MAEPATPPAGRQGELAIEARDLSVRYQSCESLAIEGLSFEQQKGQAAAILGHTGAGKSTFLKCLNGLIPHFQPAELTGTLNVLGHVPSQQSVAELSGKVGIVFQEFENQLFSTDVEQEVAFGPENLGVQPDEIRARVSQCLSLVGLSGFEHREPASLSGGEKQRLAIASVLAMRPELLLLDEPTTDLDPDGTASVRRIISSLRAQGTTILLVDHQIENLLDFDGIALMKAGRVVLRGRPAEVCKDTELLMSSGVRPHTLALASHLFGLPNPLLDSDQAYSAVDERFVLNRGEYGRILDEERRSMSSSPPLIEVNHLSHCYEKGQFALEDVSLSIARGEFMAIVGPNGSGKTSLVKHLNGLLRPTQGHVLFQGREASRVKLSKMARHVGYVFQNPDSQIFCETVEQEVRFGPKNLGYSEKEIERLTAAAIETVDLEGLEKADPFCLTKGQRQRVAIASALACDPDVLVLDEPITGLDYSQARKVMSMLQNLNSRGKTIVFIAHSLWLVCEYARRVVALSHGGIVFDGPVREFFSQGSQDALLGAGLAKPMIVELSHRFGITALSASEFARLFIRRSEGQR